MSLYDEGLVPKPGFATLGKRKTFSRNNQQLRHR
jgi:hypothetical protein